MTLEIEAPDGSVVEFPDGTPDVEIERAMQAAFPSPVAPRASQADVRAAEPQPMLARDEQTLAERKWERARQAYLKKYGTKPRGKTLSEHIEDFSGLTDPAKTRDQAVQKNLEETGEFDYQSEPGYGGLKTAAAIGGFAAAGPAGATGAEFAVRYLTLSQNLDRAVKAGTIDEDRASEILAKELVKGAGTDAAFNFGLPLLGQLAMKVPGAKWITDKAGAAVQRLMGGKAAPKPSLRDTKIASRAELTDDPARKQAVQELSKRVGDDFIPTPGQVKGKSGVTETVVNKAFPGAFEEQEKALGTATEGMRRELLYPGGQPSAKALGNRVVKAAEDVVAGVKQRLRPVFQAADDVGVAVDMSPVADVAKKALAEDARVLGGKLTETERAHLKKIVEDAKTWPTSSAESALDFISAQKEALRKINVDGKPTDAFSRVIGDLSKSADTAYSAAARQMGRGDVVRQLELARKDYREMMETVYDDALKVALKKEGGGAPEDIGQFLWQNGKVSRIEQLDDMLKLAIREKKMSPAAADKMRRDVTRGFLQEAVQDVKAAAEWSKTLAKDPRKARTWEVLTAGPNGKALRDGMAVLENAAQMATLRDTAASKTFIPLGRAASGGLGVSWVTGAIHPGMAVGGLSVAAVMKMMSTAYTRGDKGALNLMARVLRTNSASTAAAAKAMQSMLPDLEALAVKYGAEDLFVPAEAE